jgi:acetyltransferase-like isoleucine patch superfamily enzyme
MGNYDVALLKCTSSYPAPIEEANMCMVKDLAERYNVISGLSDHTMGSTVPVVATVFGAKIIEKHFIIDRAIGGPDASFSMNEEEFTAMVKAVREAEKASGIIDYNLTEKQVKGRDFSRSLYIAEDINAGEIFTEKNLRSVRPGFGLHPKYYNQLLGVEIGNNCNISHNVRIYTLSNIPDVDFNVKPITNKKGDVIIGNAVWIGANVFINPGITIGENAIVGANSVVTKDIEPMAIYGGVPAKFIRYKKISE